MSQKRVLLVGWLFALSPAIVGLVGDTLVSFGALSDDGSGGPAIMIMLLVYTVPMGVCGHLYTRWYYRKALEKATQGETLLAPSPIILLALVVLLSTVIALSWID